jgi:hypothetical protein
LERDLHDLLSAQGGQPSGRAVSCGRSSSGCSAWPPASGSTPASGRYRVGVAGIRAVNDRLMGVTASACPRIACYGRRHVAELQCQPASG